MFILPFSMSGVFNMKIYDILSLFRREKSHLRGYKEKINKEIPRHVAMSCAVGRMMMPTSPVALFTPTSSFMAVDVHTMRS